MLGILKLAVGVLVAWWAIGALLVLLVAVSACTPVAVGNPACVIGCHTTKADGADSVSSSYSGGV